MKIELEVEGVQAVKIKHLQERGYRIESAKFLMSNDNNLCTVDTYGQVKWWNMDEEKQKGG